MNKTTILGIQTAQFPNSLALINNKGKVLASIEIKKEKQTVELLKIKFEELKKRAKVDIEDITLISVCLGPGSYTGSRGGLAFAKGFCQFNNTSLIGVSAFDVLEFVVDKKPSKSFQQVVSLLDARNDRVYYKFGSKKGIKVDNIRNILKKIKKETLFIGSGAIVYKKDISKVLGDKAQFIREELNYLKAEDVARVGCKRYKREPSIFMKEYLYKLKPLYILPPNITKPKVSDK